MKYRMLASLFAAGRVAFGLAMLVAPERLARSWVGSDGDTLGGRVLTRSLGARDIALGAGTLGALKSGRGVRSWLLAGALADAADIAGTVAAGDGIPSAGRRNTTAIALLALVLGAWLLPKVD